MFIDWAIKDFGHRLHTQRERETDTLLPSHRCMADRQQENLRMKNVQIANHCDELNDYSILKLNMFIFSLIQFFAPLVDQIVKCLLLSLNLRNPHENDARSAKNIV